MRTESDFLPATDLHRVLFTGAQLLLLVEFLLLGDFLFSLPDLLLHEDDSDAFKLSAVLADCVVSVLHVLSQELLQFSFLTRPGFSEFLFAAVEE